MIFRFLASLMARSRTQKAFNNVYSMAIHSKAYLNYSNIVHKSDFLQFNNLSQPQREDLIETLGPKENDKILDLGCGFGLLSEHLAINYGPKMTAIDIANKGFTAKSENVQFLELDIQLKSQRNKLIEDFGPFDSIISIDSIYGLNFPDQVFADLIEMLSPSGKLIFTYTLYRIEGNDIYKSKIGPALKKLNSELKVEIKDFTKEDLNFWHKSHETLERMAPEFKFGQDFGLWHIKRKEASNHLQAHEDNEIKRFTVIIQKQPSSC